MKMKMGIAGGLVLAVTGTAFGSGYRIPEQSVNATARSGGYIAYTPGADAAYYNPANMAWLDDRAYLEADATWIHLNSIDYTDNRTSYYSGTSEEEDFVMPTFFAVSPDYNGLRVGFAFTAPAGLSKQWQDPFPRTIAEEFTLKVFESNPSLSYNVTDWLSLAAGVRAVYAEGTVKSNGQVATGISAKRELEGDAWEAGYNLALTVKPMDKMHVSVTYRSEVELGIEGDADLYTSAGPSVYSGDSGVEIPLPAVLAVACSYTFFDQLTLELSYDRTYWSGYESLDFTYPSALSNPVLSAAFDVPRSKQWNDTDAWRLSASYDLKNGIIFMAGIAIDENPVPESTLSFELPDSDAVLYSLGMRYQLSDDLELGLAYLYDDKESRDVVNETINGSFENAAAHLVTVGISYKL